MVQRHYTSDELLCANIQRLDDTTTTFVQTDGLIVPTETIAKLYALTGRLLQAAKDAPQSNSGSTGDFMLANYRAALLTDEFAHIDPQLADQFIEFTHKFHGVLTGTDNWFESSRVGWSQQRSCAGEQLLNWRHRGYRTVFDLLQKEAGGAPLDVQYGREVRRIEWKAAATTTAADDGGASAPICVECSDGSRWSADHLVCTVSLGVLKERCSVDDWFVPALPAA